MRCRLICWRGGFSSGGALGRLCPRAAAAAALALPGPARSAAQLPLGRNSSFLHFLNVFLPALPTRLISPCAVISP